MPEWIKASVLTLGGVQPITGAMAKAAGGELHDQPSAGELTLFRERGARFQLVVVVVSVARFIDVNGVPHGVPYALTLQPATKRGRVSEVGVDYVEKINLSEIVARTQPAYAGFDPFTGEWQAWGAIDIFLSDQIREGFPDELGLVYDQFYLATEYDPDDVLEVDMLTNERANRKYRRHRQNLMFRPFADTRARRIWGAELPIELFLFQALLQRGLSPSLQMLFFSDGSVFPSLYHFWTDASPEEVPELITEADMYFCEQRLAVFCDSNRHHRGAKAARKDALVSERLAAIGVGTRAGALNRSKSAGRGRSREPCHRLIRLGLVERGRLRLVTTRFSTPARPIRLFPPRPSKRHPTAERLPLPFRRRNSAIPVLNRPSAGAGNESASALEPIQASQISISPARARHRLSNRLGGQLTPARRNPQ